MKRIAVLGNGLLGGSIALAVQTYMPQVEVCLWGRRQQSVDEALSMGIRKSTTDLAEALSRVDLIILASPVGAMLQILQAAADISSLEGVMITDVGSVKLTPREILRDLVKKIGAYYIGSHPMAGSEQAGVLASDKDLFQQAACIITNDFEYAEEKVASVESFWSTIGCRCYKTTSEDHDQAMARISHMPHMLASVGALVGLKYPENAVFAGNGMRDTTRVAAGHPGMWAEIMLSNKEALKEPITETINYLREMLALLEDSSEEELTKLLDDAKQLRDSLN